MQARYAHQNSRYRCFGSGHFSGCLPKTLVLGRPRDFIVTFFLTYVMCGPSQYDFSLVEHNRLARYLLILKWFHLFFGAASSCCSRFRFILYGWVTKLMLLNFDGQEDPIDKDALCNTLRAILNTTRIPFEFIFQCLNFFLVEWCLLWTIMIGFSLPPLLGAA